MDNRNFIENTLMDGHSNTGGWRDTLLRKYLNDNKFGIWNAIVSNDFKQNITPVLKITNNAITKDPYYYGNGYSNVSSITIDKLFILSQSEIGMPIIRNYNVIAEQRGYLNGNANVHYFDMNSYKNTIKSSNDGNYDDNWVSQRSYIYIGNTYQWWMLPAGSRKMSNGSQAYHNTDSYSYCGISSNSYSPSSNKTCSNDSFWLRAAFSYFDNPLFSYFYYGGIDFEYSDAASGVVLAFAF